MVANFKLCSVNFFFLNTLQGGQINLNIHTKCFTSIHCINYKWHNFLFQEKRKRLSVRQTVRWHCWLWFWQEVSWDESGYSFCTRSSKVFIVTIYTYSNDRVCHQHMFGLKWKQIHFLMSYSYTTCIDDAPFTSFVLCVVYYGNHALFPGTCRHFLVSERQYHRLINWWDRSMKAWEIKTRPLIPTKGNSSISFIGGAYFSILINHLWAGLLLWD